MRLLSVLGLAFLAGACSAEPAARPPDILLVIVDTLRADRTSALGAPELTPNLQALGQRGAVYRRAVAPSSWTLPSMAAIFSGRDAYRNRHAAHDEAPALAEQFRAAGYRTVGWSANPLLTQTNGFARGFDEYHVAPASSTASLLADLQELRAWDAEALVERALATSAATPSEQPLFLFLQLMDTHVPYDPAHESLANPEEGWSSAVTLPWLPHPTPPQQALLTGWRRAYDGQVRFTDHALGRLFSEMERVRQRPPLIAVTSDHGEGLFSHRRAPDSTPGTGPLGAGYPDHGEQAYEEALRVPLWLGGPGVPAGHEETRLVAVRDLGRTLLQLAVPAAAPNSLSPRLPLTEHEAAPPWIAGATTRDWFLITNDRKFTQPFPERAAFPEQLWEVSASSYLSENENLVPREPETAARLRALCEAWRRGDDSRGEESIDPETAARMDQLGYTR
ncbi:MAG: sulfatase [Planctomycetota bacterium]